MVVVLGLVVLVVGIVVVEISPLIVFVCENCGGTGFSVDTALSGSSVMESSSFLINHNNGF